MRTREATLEWLSTVPMFRALSPRQAKGLVSAGKERDYPAGATIVRRGEEGLGFYLILDGEAEVRRGRRTLAHLGRGEFFGEMTLLDRQPRSADVVATRTTRCLTLSPWEFWGFVADKPTILREMVTEMGRRLRRTDLALSE